MKKRDFIHQPVCVAGKVVLEFFNNDDDSFKHRALEQLKKSLQKDFHVACAIVEEHQIEDPTRGSFVYSFVSTTRMQAGETLEKVLQHIDTNAQGRITLEESDVLELF